MLLGSEIFLMTAAGVSLAIIGAWCSHLVAADWLRSWLF
jgi:hypothetical protein